VDTGTDRHVDRAYIHTYIRKHRRRHAQILQTHPFTLNAFGQVVGCRAQRLFLARNVFKSEHYEDLAKLQVQIREGVPH